MDPAPQSTNSDAQPATPSNPAPITPTPKPVTVAAPKAAPRAMGQIFTVSGILEGDEGTEFSPDENREVAEQQVRNVLEEVAREQEEEEKRFQERWANARSVKDSIGEQSEEESIGLQIKEEDEGTGDDEDAVKGRGNGVASGNVEERQSD